MNRGFEVGATASSGPAGAGVVPIGGIIMWSGLIAAIPATWALCDGTLNAPGPDLRDVFVVGARQDSGGVPKTNIEGSLKQTGGMTGHSHSGHAALTHTGASVADHTGLTHGLTIANHPDLTHAALSHAASTFTHADHSIASQSHTHAAITLTQPSHVSGADVSVAAQTIASHVGITVASHSHAVVTIVSGTGSKATGGTAVTFVSVSGVSTLSGPSFTTHGASITTQPVASTLASRPGLTHADISVASFSGSQSAVTATHADHSFPSLSHQAIGTHVGTDYGVHAFTAPAAHGAAGTLTHSFTEPNDHSISAHDSVLSLPNYFALAYIQRMS